MHFPAGPTPVQSDAMFLRVRSGEGQRSEAWPLGNLAEAAACGGVWQLGHDCHFQEETSLPSAPGPGWDSVLQLFLLFRSLFLINTALNLHFNSKFGSIVNVMKMRMCCFINLCLSANESSVPLSRPPPRCGYSVQTTWRDLRLMAQYDACHVTRKVWEPCGMCCLSDSFFTVNTDKWALCLFSVLFKMWNFGQVGNSSAYGFVITF